MALAQLRLKAYKFRKILLNCENNSHHVSLQAPAHSAFAGNVAFTLPTTTGSNGQALITNGSGVLSFANTTETKPTLANVSQTIAPSSATTINITGTNFVAIPIVDFINASTGAVTRANSVSTTSATSLSVNLTLASGNYLSELKILMVMLEDQQIILLLHLLHQVLNWCWIIGTFAGDFSGTIATIAGSSDSAITFSGGIRFINASQANCSLNSSTGAITTTDFGGSSTTPTTYTFTIRITDAEGQTAERSFSLTSSFERLEEVSLTNGKYIFNKNLSIRGNRKKNGL